MTRIRVRKSIGDPEPTGLTPQQRKEWNNYVDWLEAKGYKGSPLLDKKETGLAVKLFNQFKQENPSVSITLNHIASVQSEMQKLKDTAQSFAQRHGDKNASNIMSGVSKVDSWPGSKTTSFKFPDMVSQQYNNSSLVSQKNLGLIDSRLQPSGLSGATKPIPKNVKIEQLYDNSGKPTGKGYVDENGDIVIVNQ